MTIKEELEILRGEPIEVFAGDPMDIPCIETSDAEKLCKHPVVSVHMITYNHEPYIRQAIEGVMMQKTDFEFELVIGEDCSQDKTREICFEYQKRYPDKIRVLWAEVNVNKLGGNGRRTGARCRGEFIAYCEGDDYWTDPLKLQKQVDVMRRYPNVGFCFGDSLITEVDGDKKERWTAEAFRPGLMNGLDFFKTHCFGKAGAKQMGPECFIMTQTVMVRRKIVREAVRRYEIFSWRLALGDTTCWLGVSSLSDVYCLKDVLAVYRRTSRGAIGSNGERVHWDSKIVRLYYSVAAFGMPFDQAFRHWREELAISAVNDLKRRPFAVQIGRAWAAVRNPLLRKLLVFSPAFPAWLLSLFGCLNLATGYLPLRIIVKWQSLKR